MKSKILKCDFEFLRKPRNLSSRKLLPNTNKNFYSINNELLFDRSCFEGYCFSVQDRPLGPNVKISNSLFIFIVNKKFT